MTDSIFTKILNKEIPSKIVYEDDKFFIINDINPIAPVHMLLIPKRQYAQLSDMASDDAKNLSDMFLELPRVLNELGVKNGYRLILNQGNEGGQEVPHLHFHILAGKMLDWKNL